MHGIAVCHNQRSLSRSPHGVVLSKSTTDGHNDACFKYILCDLQVQQQQQQYKRETRARYLVSALPVDVTSIAPPTTKPNPKLGISVMSWSPDSQLLATVNENMPHAVWVWDVTAAALTAVLLHVSSVRSLAWAPTGKSVVLCF